MKITRTLPCSADELFAALERRFLDECAAHGAEFNTLDRGVGYEEPDLGVSVRVEGCARGRRLSWRAKTLTDEVVSTYEMSPCDTGCDVTLSRDYVSGLPARGGLAEALLLGRMSNELLGLCRDVESEREGVACPRWEAKAPALSERLLRKVLLRGRS